MLDLDATLARLAESCYAANDAVDRLGEAARERDVRFILRESADISSHMSSLLAACGAIIALATDEEES